MTKLADGGGYTPANITLTATVTGMTSPLITFYYSPTGSEGTYTQISTSTGTAVATAVISSATYLTQKGSGAVVHYKATAAQTGILSSFGTMFVPYSETGNTGPTGVQGPTGPTGTAGATGATAVKAYKIQSGGSLPAAPAVPIGAPTAGNATGYTTWYTLPPSGALSSSEWLFIADGTVLSGSYTWVSPSYLATFKVGALSALTVDTGALNVSGALTVGTSGHMKGGQTDYATGTGYYLGYSGGAYKFSIGSSTNYLRWDGTNLQATVKGMYVESLSFAGAYAALGWSGSVAPVIGYNTSSTAGNFTGSSGSYANVATGTYGVYGYASSYGLYGAGGSYGVYGTGSSFGVYGYSSGAIGIKGDNNGNDVAILGTSNNAGASAHAIRGTRYGGTSTGGLIGAANGFDFYAEGGGTNYGPFTGAHDALLALSDIVETGDIVVDSEVVYKKGVSNIICRVTLTTSPNQKGTVGVIASIPKLLATGYTPAVFTNIIKSDYTDAPTPIPEYDTIKNNYSLVAINALGEGQVNVCGENGNIEIGDLITASSIPGKGMKQSDDIVRGYTVAKARENLVFSSPTEVKMIGCIYLCG
jgi:hypothetical protein